MIVVLPTGVQVAADATTLVRKSNSGDWVEHCLEIRFRQPRSGSRATRRKPTETVVFWTFVRNADDPLAGEIGYQPERPLTAARFDHVQNYLWQNSPGWQIMVR
jgi:hypothetical protein